MANAFSNDRYQVRQIEARGPYLWKVIDTEKHNRICARSSQREFAEKIAEQLNRTGKVESI